MFSYFEGETIDFLPHRVFGLLLSPFSLHHPGLFVFVCVWGMSCLYLIRFSLSGDGNGSDWWRRQFYLTILLTAPSPPPVLTVSWCMRGCGVLRRHRVVCGVVVVYGADNGVCCLVCVHGFTPSYSCWQCGLFISLLQCYGVLMANVVILCFYGFLVSAPAVSLPPLPSFAVRSRPLVVTELWRFNGKIVDSLCLWSW